MLANSFLLHDALVSLHFTARLYVYYLASAVPSVVCLVLGLRLWSSLMWLWAYYFVMETMAMAAFFGYILAVNLHRKEILASEGREQPAVQDDEPDDQDEDKEPAPAASTGQDAGAQRYHLKEHHPLFTDPHI